MVIHTDGNAATPAEKRRKRWGENLKEHVDARGMTVKQFHAALRTAGVEVTIQAVYMWLKGDTAPRPELQGQIAEVLGTRAHLLFPVSA